MPKTLTKKASGDKHTCLINLRLKPEAFEELKRQCGGDEPAVFARKLVLAGLKKASADVSLRDVVAFTVGALSDSISEDEVLPLFEEYLATKGDR